MKKIIMGLIALLVSANAYAGTVSFDQLAVSSDLTVGKYNGDLDRIYQKVNSNIQTDNIADDTVAEVDMADDANPRLRTYESAACEKVYTGLLPTETVGTLVGSVPSGTAYPRGYRVVKASSTPKTWTASKWTFVDIDINGTLTYSEVAINGSTPAIATNSIRLARVSTDGTHVVSVQDLRTTNCAAGPFENLSDASGEATLDDLLANGQPVRRFSQAGRSPVGYVTGFNVSYDSVSTLMVTKGAAYINGKFRYVSTDTTITTGNDAPATGGSGLDTGTVTGGPVQYYVYAVADVDASPTASFSYSTSATAPAGVTNYRLLGSIRTDATNLFTSNDVVTAHAISSYELPFAWARIEGNAGAVKVKKSFNISSISENATGSYTVTFNYNPASADYVAVGDCGSGGSALGNYFMTMGTITTSTAKFFCINTAASAVTTPDVFVEFKGDARR